MRVQTVRRCKAEPGRSVKTAQQNSSAGSLRNGSAVWLAIALIVFGSGLAASSPTLAQALDRRNPTDCDLLAAYPDDPQRVGNGIRAGLVEPEIAIPACQLAISKSPTTARFYYQLARGFDLDDRAEMAFPNVEHAAKLGHIRSLVLLGTKYINGIGVPKDAARGVAYYLAAAEKRDPDAYVLYAQTLLEGSDVNARAAEALRWLNEALELGATEAASVIAWAHSTGTGVVKDEREAFRTLQRAAEKGQAFSQSSLAYYYANGIGVEKNASEAFKWSLRAAENGEPVAQYHLAYRYDTGNGVAKDQTEAAKWLRKSAEGGFAEAQSDLGILLQSNFVVAADPSEGLRWLTRAAKQGLVRAQFFVSNAYADGLGTPKDDEKSASWLLKAAKNGHQAAQLKLARAYIDGAGVKVNEAEARLWLDKAKQQGDKEAEQLLLSLSQRQRLRTSYDNYLAVKDCFDLRQGYILPVIGEFELNEARSLMRKIEDSVTLNRTEKNALWDKSVEKAKGRKDGMMVWNALGNGGPKDSSSLDALCSQPLVALRKAIEPEVDGKRKRDF